MNLKGGTILFTQPSIEDTSIKDSSIEDLLIEILSYNGTLVTSHPDYAFTIREIVNGGSPNYYTLDIFNGSSSAQWNYTEADSCAGYYTAASVSSSPISLYVP